ncbi:MAG: phosphoenolpyruvate carboxykinase, partial [Candidatus Omnitrophica bacterium]|nr:phosphoenolpyruvate carboxykinase [Candidatus Omnitrophota bacterium]
VAKFCCQTVFFDDVANKLLVGAVPLKDEFGYFGYLKKMVLTLHNVIMMKRGILPYHGALVRVILKGNIDRTILFMGDTGAGKSETLEAFRGLGEGHIQDLIIIADDMGSLQIGQDGKIMGYGTEIGAFLRLDDLQPGYALGQIDRAIIMSANQVNARIIIPVTTYEEVIKGEQVDFILYANNYDVIDDDHPIIDRFKDVDSALNVFREGTAMSKGTTTSTGLVHSYFANVFGPAQFRDLHEPLARKYFEQCFKANVFVGQMRTRLGLAGWERTGPQEAAKELLEIIRKS